MRITVVHCGCHRFSQVFPYTSNAFPCSKLTRVMDSYRMQPSPTLLSCDERSRAQTRVMRRVLAITRLGPEHEYSSTRITRAHPTLRTRLGFFYYRELVSETKPVGFQAKVGNHQVFINKKPMGTGFQLTGNVNPCPVAPGTTRIWWG